MTIKKLMMAAGAIDGPQVIAPSSNDWDYTFDGGGDWPFAGNALGDGTSGGYVNNTGGDSAIYSLHTFDGDFEIEWTGTVNTRTCFGVHAIAEDATRAAQDKANMHTMTNSFFYREQVVQDFFIGSSAQSDSNVFGAGSVIKFERISGVIKVYDDGAEVHEFSTTYSGTVRFAMAGPGAPYNLNFDNLLFTDTEKVQRDGMLYEGHVNSRNVGENTSYADAGYLFRATRSGNVTDVKFNIDSVGASYTSNVQIYVHDGTNPTGSALATSTSRTITTGINTWNFSSPYAIEKGNWYWAVLVDEGSSGEANIFTGDGHAHTGSGRHNAIASITDNLADNWDCEIVVDTSAGEPTPDHDTLLLIHSDTSDGSTTFTDSSQNGRTITVAGDAQHDTAQKKFGTSSMYFDGTGDYATAPDHADWDFSGDFTVDFWGRVSSAFSAQGDMVGIADGGSYASMNFVFQLTASRVPTFYFGGGSVVLEGSAISIDTWVHFAAVRVGSRFNLYQAGTSTATATSTSAVNAKSIPLTIGRRGSGDNYFKGWLDEVRVSNVARWDANFTPPSAPYP